MLARTLFVLVLDHHADFSTRRQIVTSRMFNCVSELAIARKYQRYYPYRWTCPSSIAPSDAFSPKLYKVLNNPLTGSPVREQNSQCSVDYCSPTPRLEP